MRLLPLLAFLAFLTPLAACQVAPDRQYVVVNIIPGEDHREIFEQVSRLRAPGATQGPALGIAAIFSYLHVSPEQCANELRAFLSLSREFDLPIVVQLDGEQWWASRPDLWNWWDPTRAGYDPANRVNVEWYGWGPQDAMKIAWRNWGRQIRVLPPPNFMSPRYREACHREMRMLIPLVLEWWKGLPPEERDLLIAIKLGWESAIGVNAFTIPGGNDLLEKPENDDPQISLKAELVPDRGVLPIGYAAVTSAGLARGGELTEAHLAEVVRRHLNDLCSLAADLGVPQERLFTHVGGWKEEELLYNTPLNAFSCPGWSFYRHAADPGKDRGVQNALRKSDAPYWGAVEWLLEGKQTEEAWCLALQRTLSIPRCRYVCIYNWSGIREDRAAVGALRSLLGSDRE